MKTLKLFPALFLISATLCAGLAVADDACQVIQMQERWAKVCSDDHSITLDIYVASTPQAADWDVSVYVGVGSVAGKSVAIPKGFFYNSGNPGDAIPSNCLLLTPVTRGATITAHLRLDLNSGDLSEHLLVEQALRNGLDFAIVINDQWDSRFGQNYHVSF